MLPVFERNKTLKKFILKRIYTAFIVVLFVVALNFFIIKLAPGDPVNIMAGFDNPSEEFKMAIRAKYNLDKPLITQFFTYIYRLVQGGPGRILLFQSACNFPDCRTNGRILTSFRNECHFGFCHRNTFGAGRRQKRK